MENPILVNLHMSAISTKFSFIKILSVIAKICITKLTVLASEITISDWRYSNYVCDFYVRYIWSYFGDLSNNLMSRTTGIITRTYKNYKKQYPNLI